MARVVDRITSLLTLILFVFVVLNRANDDITSSNTAASKSKDNGSFETFIATYEWQTVQKGQPIPKGLHVRINFETGQTEAKLLDPVETTKTATAVSAVSAENKEDEFSEDSIGNSDNILAREYLREALGKMNDEAEELTSENDEADIVKQFRTYEELKKDLKGMNMLVKTDLEVLTTLMANFTTSSEQSKITILTDLELLVHQFDNAREFARLDGFIDIVYPSFNSTNTHIRAEAIKLFGSATQSNPQVQISALSSGGVQLLLRTLLLDKELTVRSRALYALSCLIRNFPLAQNKMFTEGGLDVLSQVFDKKENSKLQVKVVTLLHDLVEERTSTEQSIVESQNPSKETKQRLLQYRTVNFERKLVESEWCERIPSLLRSDSAKLDDDGVEKVVTAMFSLADTCGQGFKREDVMAVLHDLANSYEDSVAKEPDQYYTDLATLIQNLIVKLKPVHDEL